MRRRRITGIALLVVGAALALPAVAGCSGTRTPSGTAEAATATPVTIARTTRPSAWPAASDPRSDAALRLVATSAPDSYARMRQVRNWAITDCDAVRQCAAEFVARTTYFEGDPHCWTMIHPRNEARAAREYGLDRLRYRAFVLVHEVEHCKAEGNDLSDERPSLDAEHDFAVTVGDKRMLRIWRQDVASIDQRGRWRD